jgi:hypothetical protein
MVRIFSTFILLLLASSSGPIVLVRVTVTENYSALADENLKNYVIFTRGSYLS